MAYNKIANQFTSIEQLSQQYLKNKTSSETHENKNFDFADILKKKQDATNDISAELKFSKHATNRMASRNINLSTSQSKRLEAGVQKASEKGINESLVIVDSMAFIVNIKNKTVVTALNQEESKSNIFTNIDGAIIM
ncbi:TIGR02530 family flagellar biosynthesis protein [Lachnobacterium bovis]|uniref:Flagellar operon protein n=1 Tax=Lachnobacterium bovis TaxID=140626 RepID=A0A1H9Q7R2_9FIRM|nr:TIGR02530 family flagellar biosynthesis protein [Lachnobacterium bovis]SER55883.1 flagellar operon protein [Lachnobacterium bovis]